MQYKSGFQHWHFANGRSLPTGVPGPDIYQDWVGRVNLYLYFDLMNYVLQTSTGAASSDNPRLGLLSIMSLGEVVKPSQFERKEDCCGKGPTNRKNMDKTIAEVYGMKTIVEEHKD